MPFRAGDSVRHGPTGETLTLGCDEFDDVVIGSGWAESLYLAADCELVAAADDDLRARVLRVAADGPTGYRRREAMRALGLTE